MLERDGALMTWRLLGLPEAWQADTVSETPIAAERIADHRLDYLAFEGPISGARGEVHRVDAGEYLLIEESPEDLLVALRGETFHWRGSLPLMLA
jgi:hypothetical protein